jgi:hypothetical protein
MIVLKKPERTNLEMLTVLDLMVDSASKWQHSQSDEPSRELAEAVVSRPDCLIGYDSNNVPVGFAVLDEVLPGLSVELHFMARRHAIKSMAVAVAELAASQYKRLYLTLYSNQRQAIRLAEAIGFDIIATQKFMAMADGKPVSRLIYQLTRTNWRANPTWRRKQTRVDVQAEASA